MKKLFGAFLILAVVASGFANVNSIKAHALADTSNQFSTSEVVEAGGRSSFRLDISGSLWAWGDNVGGQLGDGTITNKLAPVKVLDNVKSFSGGDVHTLAIKTDGSLWAWGDNTYGQLGIGDGTNIRSNKITPIKVMENVVSVSAGEYHTLAIKNDGSLWAWGYNGYGQLGDGTTIDKLTPVKVMDNVVSVSAGYFHTLAIKTDGSLWAWGDNGGLLGDGTTIEKLTPIKVMENVASVSAGTIHTVAIKSDGSLWTWGFNNHGQLGDGTTITKLTPIKVMENVVSVSASEHTLVIKTDGSLWAWGDNYCGALGDGTTIDKLTPIKVMENVASVSAGDDHTLAIKNDGSLWAWGTNHYGQLGDGTTIEKSTPIKVMDKTVLVLGIPTHLSVSIPTATSIKLSWTSVSGANGYEVFRSLSATGTYAWLANAFTTSYTNSGLTTGTTYYYKVKARNTTKVPTVYSAYTSVIAAKPVLLVLGVPTNLSVTIPTSTSIKLSWTSVSGANGYEVFRSLSATGTYTWLANAFTTSYTNSGLTTGTTYYYKVKARNTTKSPTVYSAYTTVISAKPVLVLGIPTHLSVSIPTATSIKLSWTSVSGANGYEVFRSLSATGTYTWLANAFTTSYTNSGLTTGTTYYYKVKARNTTKVPTVYSAYTSVISAKPVLVLGVSTN